MRQVWFALVGVMASGCGTSPSDDCASASAGSVCELAGTGVFAFNGDGHQATDTAFYLPSEARRGPDGLLYIMDYNNMRLRRIEPDGTISTVAGSGIHQGATVGIAATASPLENPIDFDFLPNGQPILVSYHDPRVLALADDGTLQLIAGTIPGTPGNDGDGGPAIAAQFIETAGIAVASDGTIYVSDDSANKVRIIRLDGTIDTFAGDGDAVFSGDGGPATAASISGPTALAVDASGDVFITDRGNCAIREVTPDGLIHTVAGSGTSGFGGDGGLGVDALLDHPDGVAVASDGTVFISDRNNSRIRKLTADGMITTIAGTGALGWSGDGGPATAAAFNYLSRLQVDTDGGLLISDQENSRIRKLMPPF